VNEPQHPVIYEVVLEADAAIEREFDTWLRDHVADMLALPGFLSAEILEQTDSPPPEGRITRTVLYRLRDRAALDDYLRDHAARMRAHGVTLFGDRFSARRRVLDGRDRFEAGRISTDNCLNCGEVLSGQYCSYCGQRADVRVISLWELLRDLVGDLFELDSRLWRTLRPLVTRPGLLTREYLSGRRAQYTPPFRMYLVLSVVFFLVVSTGREEPFVVQLDADNANIQLRGDTSGPPAEAAPDAQTGEPATASPEPPELDEKTQRALEALLERIPDSDRAATRQAFIDALGELTPQQRATAADRLANPCSPENFKINVPGFEQYEGRFREACNRIVADSGASFTRALWQNIPKMMFIFLPVIAFVNKLLYIGSRRYYVEHLLFFVHFHAFFFLVATVDVLLWRLAGPETAAAAQASAVAGELMTAVLFFYVPIYLYKAMRRVYGQGRFFTFLKFSMLVIAYFISLLVTFLGALAYTALTI
jgi:hypothetical protein